MIWTRNVVATEETTQETIADLDHVDAMRTLIKRLLIHLVPAQT